MQRPYSQPAVFSLFLKNSDDSYYSLETAMELHTGRWIDTASRKKYLIVERLLFGPVPFQHWLPLSTFLFVSGSPFTSN